MAWLKQTRGFLCAGSVRHGPALLSPGLLLPSGLGSSSPPFPICIFSQGRGECPVEMGRSFCCGAAASQLGRQIEGLPY